jgi:hypothetical protein
MKYYRVDKTASEIRNQTIFDDTLYIEKLRNRKDQAYYMMVEDLGKIKHAHRLRKDSAEEKIDSGRFQRDTKKEV